MCDQDGRNWKLLEPIDYLARDGRHLRIPRGAPTDGASTPAILWNKLPPFGDYWLPAVLHDAAYQNTLLQAVPNGETEATTKASLSKETCDLLLKEAMELCGVDSATVALIYEGVKLFGQSSFNEDRS